jgi:hypothetical protein
MSDCEHREIQTWFFEDGSPAGMWSCMACKRKFVPMTELIQTENELAAAKAWKEAVINSAVVGWTYSAADDDDPRGCLSRIMAMNQQIALDPAVSSDAEALIERGRQEMRAEVERLRGIVPEFLEKLNDELCAENERLRAEAEALRAVAQSLVDGTNAYGDGGRWSVNMQTVLKARAALAKEKA